MVGPLLTEWTHLKNVSPASPTWRSRVITPACRS